MRHASPAQPLTAFIALRGEAMTRRIGDGGQDTCVALTDALDAALRELSGDAVTEAAVVALGGYGRREQCLGSDIDIMVLHRGGNTEPLVRVVLYPLWDANLKVGHAVRTVDQSEEAGEKSLETLTSLLSARLVAGDATLFDELLSTLRTVIRGRPLASALTAQERRRRAEEPYPTMTANLKEGRGALRTHQSFWWERRRAELLGLPVDQPTPQETDARAALLRARNALHAAARGPTDRFLVDLREPAAAWLDTDVRSLAASVTAALDAGDRLADRRWPDLHAERDPMVGFGRRIFAVVRSRFSSPQAAADHAETPLTLAARAAGRRSGASFEAAEEQSIRNALHATWTAADRRALLMLLTAGERGRAMFRRLDDLGWVDRDFPEWGPVATAPQLAPFHDHPVGAHLWRTADEMQALIDDGGEGTAVARDIGSTEELLLAAFLHDIGKARGGDHEIIGADLAAAFLRRGGFGPATIGVVADAVRLHLLLSQTATRRDGANLEVIDEVAALVGDQHRLDVLYLLTIADLRATGTTMWNDWRATLIRSFYSRVRQAIEVGAAPPATPDIGAVKRAAEHRLDERYVEEHVAAMPDNYLDTTTPEDVLWHIETADRLVSPAALSVHPTDPGRVLVVGKDRIGFLLAVSRAFTATGVGVMEARLFTRDDGIALDTFEVRDDRTGEVVSAERWERVSAALIASLTESRDLRPTIRERAGAYRRPRHDSAAVTVHARRVGRYTALEVRTPDRVGLVTDIVEALFGEGLDVHLAKIDTVGSEARDLFLVQRNGLPIRVESELEALRRRIEDRLRT